MAEKKTELTFESALSELETIVSKMEKGDMPLEQSVEAYTRGNELVKVCRSKLNAAQTKIRKIDEDGSVTEIDDADLNVPF